MTAHVAANPSPLLGYSLPAFFVTTVDRTTSTAAPSTAALAPGTAGVAVPAMARHVPDPSAPPA